jgi:flagellar hook-associated protein 1 FlgK
VGTLFSSLDIATSGLFVSQIALDVTGHNIANVNKEGFSRQRVELASRVPITRPFGQIPRGVSVGRIGRIRDTFLDRSFRLEVPGLGEADLRARFYSQIEATFLEPTNNGFSVRLNQFFDALNDFANNVESIPSRQAAIAEGEAVSETFREAAERLRQIRTTVNDEIINQVAEINSIIEQVATMNNNIRPLEIGSREASDLRDDRDLLLDKLARLVDISVRERVSGEVEVVIAGEQAVFGDDFRALEAFRMSSLDPERSDLVQVRFIDTGRLLTPNGGEMFAAMDMRDNVLVQIDADLDAMSSTFILEMNRIHSSGTGLTNLSGTITSGNAVTDPTLALNSAGLPFTVTPGTFDLVVYDAMGVPTTTTINVAAGTTLNSLATDLSIAANITATVTATNTLDITAAGGFTFAFANDTTDALPSLGVNSFFTGTDARSMNINQDLVTNPELLTSGFDPDPAATGDNTAALALADVQNGLFYDGGAADINQFYESIIIDVGVDARANLNRLEVEQAFVQDFNRRRQEIHGVSLDEEVTNLVQYQRAFEASARVLSVADRLLETLINTVR